MKRFVNIILLGLISLVVGTQSAWAAPSAACYPKSAQSEPDKQQCSPLSKDGCLKDPKCYWGECTAIGGADQAFCNAQDPCAKDPAKCKFTRTDGQAQAGSAGSGNLVPCDFSPKDKCLKLENPLKGDTVSIERIIGQIIKAVLGLVGGLTLLMFVWGGFMWMTAAGNPERIKKGTQTMLWAAIGVFLVFASYFILDNFIKYVTGAQ